MTQLSAFGYYRRMTIDGQVHEQAFVRAFILKDRQDLLLSHPERRRKFTDGRNFKWFDMRFAHHIPASTPTRPPNLSLLRRKGAGKVVWIISEDAPIDGQEMSLEDAMEHTWGLSRGTMLSAFRGSSYFSGPRRCGANTFTNALRVKPRLLDSGPSFPYRSFVTSAMRVNHLNSQAPAT